MIMRYQRAPNLILYMYVHSWRLFYKFLAHTTHYHVLCTYSVGHFCEPQRHVHVHVHVGVTWEDQFLWEGVGESRHLSEMHP